MVTAPLTVLGHAVLSVQKKPPSNASCPWFFLCSDFGPEFYHIFKGYFLHKSAKILKIFEAFIRCFTFYVGGLWWVFFRRQDPPKGIFYRKTL